MVSIGSKALPARRHRTCGFVEDSLMVKEDALYKRGKGKKGMNRKDRGERHEFDGDNSKKTISGRTDDRSVAGRKFSKHQSTSASQTAHVRKQVDPEMAKYFSEVSNLFESDGVDIEERSVICGNALEETRGKELELATDYILSHTMQTLLEGCDVDHLCGFLQSCAMDFPSIAMDRSGSHVAETAIKSLAKLLEDNDVYSVVEETLTILCKVVVTNPVDLMCSCYGSHVLRSLLCVCKGVKIDSDFHVTKSSTVLAERLNFRASRIDGDYSHLQQGFPDLLKFLVSGMIKRTRKEIKTLQVDQFGSLVLQTALKLLAGNDEELLHAIPILLGCNKEDILEGNYIEMDIVRNVVNLMKETAFSHLMEVILEVAPEVLYNEMFTKVFKNSLFELSSHHCGNFVIQALISHARCQDQMELIWEELGPKFAVLLEMGRSGVIASLIASSQRLHSHEHKCCQALTAAVCSANESPRFIVPRILFLDNYFFCEDKSNWNWPSGARMHVLGSLILQAVFRYQSEYMQPYVTSITSMETDHVLEAVKDRGGARVIEAFLTSNASGKLKRRLVMKLRGHFGELSMHSSGSFTVEKCFTVGNLSLREAIVTELVAVQSELSKTKQGPYLIRNLDVDRFATQPDQWRSKLASKQSAYDEFYATFGSGEAKPLKNEGFLADFSKHSSHPKDLKEMRKEIGNQLSSGVPFLSTSGFKSKPKKTDQHSRKHPETSVDYKITQVKNKNLKKRKSHVESDNVAAVGKMTENVGRSKELDQSVSKTGKKRERKDDQLNTSKKKLKA
ncbi:pumilio homolog 23 isoform X2 [Juglans regia]|nr:pumilio homolog 23 isoform X2 [Juglans regia]XP_035539257.1 pumilio homolog 23 isoform X2 [Juglans regia]